MIYFVTGNRDKFAEMATIIEGIQQLDIDLPEIQASDPKEIVKEKLRQAALHTTGTFIIEDQEFYITGMNGLPGPYIKWFLKAMGNDGMLKLSQLYGADAVAKTTIGYQNEHGEVYFFEGETKGVLIESRGDLGWGWDPIFLPEGSDKTFGEMTPNEKNKFSMRLKAAEKLKQHLTS